MSCVLSHKRKRRKRLLKQIGRNIAGSLPISAETYANISIGTAVSPCATVSRETDPGPRSDDSAKGFAARRKHVQVIADVPDITKKAAVSFRKHTARHTAGESRRKAGFLYLFY